MWTPEQQRELVSIQTNIKAAMDDLQSQVNALKPEPLLSDKESALLSMILMTYCEDSDSSPGTGAIVDQLWDKLRKA